MSNTEDGVVLIVGAGDVGFRMAEFLCLNPDVRRVVLAGPPIGSERNRAAICDSLGGASASFVELDALDTAATERLIREVRPRVVVNSASLVSPWALIERTDARGKALKGAGLGLQLPAQLPVLMSVMTAVKSSGLDVRTASISFPDLTGHILGQVGLAPTIGLGNATFIAQRVEAALRRDGRDGAERVRVVAQHSQVYAVLGGQAPAAEDQVQVWLGEDAPRRDDALAYANPPIASDNHVNALAASSGARVVLALLRREGRTHLSAPAPNGLAGGYPVAIHPDRVELDLPAGAAFAELDAWHWRLMQHDGVERVDGDGTTYFTAAARAAVAEIDPALCEPLALGDLKERFARLKQALA